MVTAGKLGARHGRIKYSGEPGASDPAWRVDIRIGPSRLATRWVVALGAAAMASALFSDAGPGIALALATAVAIAAVRAIRREALREGPGALTRLVVDLDGRVEAGEAAGRLLPGSFVAPWLVVVRWRRDGSRWPRVIALPPDAVDNDAFRRLRVLLRWRSYGRKAPNVPRIQFRSSARSTR